MANHNKEMMYRNDGMAFALRVAKEKGIEGLEQEIKYRNATMLPSSIQKKAVLDFINETKQNCLDTVLIMTLNVLIDQFDFDEDQIVEFKQRFESKSECIIDDYCTWEDLQGVLIDEVNTKVEIHNKDSFK